jgi:tRNA(fMet)-specific endonuclease VapC
MSGSKNRDFDKLLFDKNQAYVASQIFQTLKRKNMLIEFRDILIASSSIVHNIPLATLNLSILRE